MLTLDEVVQSTGGEVRGASIPPRPLRFRQVVVDSRHVAQGSLFVALRGQKHDGHAFVSQALADGAAGALVERVPADCAWALEPNGDGPPLVVVPSTQRALEAMARFHLERHPRLDVVGITGSLGKTTTKEVVAGVLACKRQVMKSEGNLNSEIGLPLTVLNTLTAQHEVAVLEMGMYKIGDVRLLAELTRPRIGVVTTVQPVHLERLGSIERIQQAKQELVEALPPAADRGVAILNADDPRVAAMAAATRARVVRYGVASPEADVRAEAIESQGLRGVSFTLLHGGRRVHVGFPLLGTHSVHAALAAAAVALEEGFSLNEAAEAMHELSPSLRLLIVDGVNGSRIIDDSYNASPESVLAALNLLRDLPGRRKIAVLGDMLELGSEEAPGHRRVGNRAAGVVDLLVVLGERSRATAAEARAVGLPADRLVEAASTDEVVELLRRRLRPGDLVLVKGSRAMELDGVVRAVRVEREG